MDWHFIERHLISGVIPEAAALVLYFAVLRIKGEKLRTGHIVFSFVFCFYLLGILTTTGLSIKGSFSPRIEFIPFLDMIRSPVYTILNILLFIPLGLFLPILYDKYDNSCKVVIVGFLISLSVEIFQMFGMGTTDINDLITNTMGAYIGFGIFKSVQKSIPKSLIKQTRVVGSLCYYELPFFWIMSLFIMLTIQLKIYNAFFR